MKVISTFLFVVLLAAKGICQPFEGTVTYGIAMDNPPQGMDPAMMARFMPTQMVYSFSKDGGSRFTMDGAAAMDVLTPKGSKVTYFVNEEKKKIYVMDEQQMQKYKDEAGGSTPEITKTTETETILGYPCVRYNVKIKTKRGETTTVLWVTDKLKPNRPKFDSHGMFNEKIEGMPVKVESQNTGMSMVMTAKEISTKPVDSHYFEKPAGFTEEPFSPKAMMKQ